MVTVTDAVILRSVLEDRGRITQQIFKDIETVYNKYKILLVKFCIELLVDYRCVM